MSKLILPTDPAFKEALEIEAVRRGHHRYSEDRWGRTVLSYHPNGKPFSACPMCGEKRMTKTVMAGGDEVYFCHACHYEDCTECNFGIHTGSREEIEEAT